VVVVVVVRGGPAVVVGAYVVVAGVVTIYGFPNAWPFVVCKCDLDNLEKNKNILFTCTHCPVAGRKHTSPLLQHRCAPHAIDTVLLHDVAGGTMSVPLYG
jgi:hypothetical protein